MRTFVYENYLPWGLAPPRVFGPYPSGFRRVKPAALSYHGEGRARGEVVVEVGE